MVVDAIVGALLSALSAIFSVFSWTTPTTVDLSTGAALIGEGASAANYLMPVSLIVTFIAAGFAFDLSLTLIKFGLWVWSILPFKSS